MMEGQLYFCADQILRFKSDVDDATALPLLSVQQSLPGDDPWFLLRFFRHPVIIEQGTTLAAILIAVENWQELLSAALDRDVAAYIRAVKKPAPPASFGLDWISISRDSSVTRAFRHLSVDNENENDGSDIFPDQLTPADDFDIETDCSAYGVICGDPQHWDLSENIHEIKNLPVVIQDRQTVEFLPQEGLLAPGIDGVEYTPHRHRIRGETTLTFTELMEAIFISGLFYYSPAAAENSIRELKQYQQEAENWPSHEEESAGDDAGQELPDGSLLSIEVDDTALDSLNEHYRMESEYWQALKKSCRQYSDLPIRIGTITPARPPED